MKGFYQNLSNGMDKAEALQKAKLDYIQIADGIAAHPAFSAAFVQLEDSSSTTVEMQLIASTPRWVVIGCIFLLAARGLGEAGMRERR